MSNSKHPVNRVKPLKLPQKRPRKDGFGPAMSALSPLQRRYIVYLFENPSVPKYKALIAAGYKFQDLSASKMCSRFNQNPLFNEAVREYGAAHFTGDLPLVIRRYHDVIDNPKHRDHGRLLKDAMDRIGPSTVKETKATVHHTFDREALVAKIATIMTRNPDALKMISNSPTEQPMADVVDVEYEAVDSD